jgi:mannose-6-phosphate isomerase-like protein (cupin superfamily)
MHDKIRLVVTGQTDDGTSVFVSDEEVDPIRPAISPGGAYHRLWGSDQPPRLPSDGSPPDQPTYFPPAGGYRFGFFTLAPDSVTLPPDLDLGAALAELAEKLPGLADVAEPDHPGMHTTDTVDLDLVISGEVWLELDGGKEVRLRPGDCVVQNGTRHAWHNRGEEPATIFVTLLGATRAAR